MYSSDEPLLTVDLESTIPAYRQIVDQIRHSCISGSLAAGDVLPSVRRLALDLGVHHNTVAEAYRALGEEGWVEVSQGKPVRVAVRKAAAPRKEKRQEIEMAFERRLRLFLAEIQGQGLPVSRIAATLREIAAELDR